MTMTEIVLFFIGLLAAVLAVAMVEIVPAIKEWLNIKISNEQQIFIKELLITAVRYAEEHYQGQEMNDLKIEAALKWLEKQGLHLDVEEIEAAFWQLKNEDNTASFNQSPAA